MCFPLKERVSASWICEQLGLRLAGPDRLVRRLCTLNCLAEDGLSFALAGRATDHLHTGTLFSTNGACSAGASIITSPNPRLDFIRAQYLLEQYPGFDRPDGPPAIHPSVRIAPGAVIENDVTIGEGTIIGPNVVVRGRTRIGRNCEIQSNAAIGDAGFGFERDTRNRPLRMIHLGGVQIGDHVQIGALTSVARGSLNDTVLEDYVMINNHVHIAHNCHIGAGTIIGACADLSGSLKVGRNCWIAPNCSIRQKLVIGEGAIVGIGAVVVRDVEPGTTVYGNPARVAPSAAGRASVITVVQPSEAAPRHAGETVRGGALEAV
jgi:UDP-3-O-[3-hydroxymyristoyl] glucosamine N-acyltransferase